jgi:hypothetical protein
LEIHIYQHFTNLACIFLSNSYIVVIIEDLENLFSSGPKNRQDGYIHEFDKT